MDDTRRVDGPNSLREAAPEIEMAQAASPSGDQTTAARQRIPGLNSSSSSAQPRARVRAISDKAASRLRRLFDVSGGSPARSASASTSSSRQVARIALPMAEENTGTRRPGGESARRISRLSTWLTVTRWSSSRMPRFAVSRVASRSRRKSGRAGATKLSLRP